MSQRVIAEVDLGAIRHNLAAIRARIGVRTDVMAVVKADAYGHGAPEVARAALEAGAEWLGVASVAEGAALRVEFPGVNICVLAPFSPDEAEEIAVRRLTPLVSDLDGARALSRAAHKARGSARVHIEVDTGMGRSGALPETVVRLAEYMNRMPAMLITGMATHFPCAESDPDLTRQQLATFLKTADAVRAADTLLNYLHCASSAAILRYPQAHLNLVRPGLLLYGLLPNVPEDTPPLDVRPALTLRTHVALVRGLPAGKSLSYGQTFTLDRPARIATIPVGYGDGYPRRLSNRGHVLIGGRRAPIVGRVCMDVTLVDVTDLPDARVGDEVVLIGAQGEDRITAEEMARAIDTTEHEITTCLTRRVPRVYRDSK